MEPIETERLRLRPFIDADAPRVLAIHSRLDVIRWLGNPPFVPMVDLDEAKARIRQWHESDAADRHVVHLAIEPRVTGVVAGAVLVSPIPNDPDHGYEIGWHLHPDSVGRGYATEAAAALLDVVLAGDLVEIWCGMYPDNAASAAVAVRLGLEDLGVRPDPWYGGESRLFRTTAKQWQADSGPVRGGQ